MKVRNCLILAWATIGFLAVEGRAQRKVGDGQRPNILVILTDDQRADTIGAWGNRHISTPNIDRLVRNGFSFRRNYVFGSNNGAVCVPSRAMLMSGRTWMSIEAPTIAGTKMMPELLGESGYETFATGKWHNGEASWQRGFQRGKAIMFGGMSDHTRVPLRDLSSDGQLTPVRIGDQFSSEIFADAAIEFLENRDRRKPFFAYVALTAPHDPRQPPDRYRELYARRRPPLPSNFLPQLPFDNGMMSNLRDENLAAWPRTPEVIREQLAEYYGMISHMDEQIGRILESLQRSGEAKQTIIIYAADNGLALGSHGLLGKQSLYEHSVQVPLIFSGPGVPRGGATRAFTYLFDIFPTVCELTGIRPPTGIEGSSLRPLWRGTASTRRDSVFLPFQDFQRAVRDERWKLIAYPRIGYLQLFDLQTDPGETRNLIEQPKSGPHLRRLQQLMNRWQSQLGDKVEIPPSSRPPAPIDLTGKPRKPDQWQPEWIIKKYFDQ